MIDINSFLLSAEKGNRFLREAKEENKNWIIKIIIENEWNFYVWMCFQFNSIGK